MALHAPSAVCAATILPDVPVRAVCVGTTSQSPLSDQLQLMNSDCRRAVQGLFADLVDRCLKDAVNQIRGKDNLQCEEDVAMMFLTRGTFPISGFCNWRSRERTECYGLGFGTDLERRLRAQPWMLCSTLPIC